MYNIFYIIFPWFFYLIPILILLINYLYSGFAKLIFNHDHLTHPNQILQSKIAVQQDLDKIEKPIKDRLIFHTERSWISEYKNINILLLIIYFINSLNYYLIYNNLDIIYNGYIINPSLIILFCFVLFAFIIIIL